MPPLFIEAPANFYLGRQYDPQTGKNTPNVVYYDARDLTTHAVVVGMTGSGKTGLCINLLEEAILDGIPAVVIDPKGDITNLLLNFPDLRPEDFAPWINVDDARRAGMDVNTFAADTAYRWREGLSSWGVVPDRMRWLKHVANYSIYTPGSDAGLPVSILASLRAPRDGWQGNEEANREKINGIVTALLALVGRDAQPLQDKEHVLVANIFEFAWQQGRDLTLEDIILQVQRPPFARLGVFPIDEYISERQRAKLAMELNSIVAAPSFQSWLNGDPMDFHRLLYTPDGSPRVSIFYIAHLSEAERQFVITLLLENALGWMRTQSGTTSLRSLLYIDEVFGYFPPHPRNPPTKEPMMRLLKQARAFGLGMILATQNPGDLDYKGLSNAGTWFIGRLQSDNDKQRVIAGLDALATTDNDMGIKEAQRLIADIPPRVFLMHNVHDKSGPTMLHTRWAMSYLRGPLTRQQISALMVGQRAAMGRAPQMMQGYAPHAAPPQQYAPAPSAPYTPPAPVGAPPSAPVGFAAAQSAASSGAWWQDAPPSAPPPPTTMPEMPPSLPEMPSAPPQQQAYPAAPPPYQPYGGAPQQQPYPAYGGQYDAPPPQPYGGGTEFGAQTAPYAGQTPAYTGQTPPPSQSQPVRRSAAPAGYAENPPPISAAVAQYYLPINMSADQAFAEWQRRTNFAVPGAAARLAYQPVLMAQATVRFQDKRTQMYTARQYAYLVPDLDRAGIVHWQDFVTNPVDTRRLGGSAQGAGALYGDLPPGLADSKRMTALKRELGDALYTTISLKIPYSSTLNIYGSPDGDFSQFRAQLQQAARERRDAEIDTLTRKYEASLDAIDDQKRKKAVRLQGEKQEQSERRREELFTTGEAVLGLLRGRTTYTLSRMSNASVRRKISKGEIEAMESDLSLLEENEEKLVQEYEEAVRQVNEKWARIATTVEEFTVTPFKKDVSIDLFGIGWVPYWFAEVGGQPLLLPAM
jgi:hypothetical protein